MSALAMTVLTHAARAEPIKVYAAGSLKAALTEAARNFEAKNQGTTIALEFGASGLLRERIEKGEPAHLFISADMGHPQKLVEQGKSVGPVARVTRNILCGLAKGGLDVSADTLLAVILKPDVRLGMSTPKADPSGDYAMALFAKAEAVSPGSNSALEGKALQLTGGPTSPKAPEGRNLYAWVVDSGQADVFLTYCTNAKLAKAERASLEIVELPQQLSVGADYGMVVLNGAPAGSTAFATFMAGSDGQAILARYGFK